MQDGTHARPGNTSEAASTISGPVMPRAHYGAIADDSESPAYRLTEDG